MLFQISVFLPLLVAVPTINALAITPNIVPKDVTHVLKARALAVTEVVNLNVDFNDPAVLPIIDSGLPAGVQRTSPIEVSWSPYSSLASEIKARTTKPHAGSDPVIRVAIALSVDTGSRLCGTEGAHLAYYIFPDNSGALMTGLVDAWDTLTDDGNLCEGTVNDKLRAIAPTKLSLIQSLVDVEFRTKVPQEHFGSFIMASDPTRILLQRDTIVSRWNNLCMDVRKASKSDGAVVQQYGCNDSRAQKFNRVAVGTATETEPQHFVIQNYNSAKCVAPAGGSALNGAGMVQVQCNTLDRSQLWKSVDPGFGNQLGANWVVNVRSGKCLDVPNWSQVPGTQLQQVDCVGGWKDYWYNTGITFP